eukprot:4057335-Pyramimonas_sp.AAC.1
MADWQRGATHGRAWAESERAQQAEWSGSRRNDQRVSVSPLLTVVVVRLVVGRLSGARASAPAGGGGGFLTSAAAPQ